jgi:hypothetical protein
VRALRLLVLLAILPGLLLPSGFLWSLCRCAEKSPAACCATAVVAQCCCCCAIPGASAATVDRKDGGGTRTAPAPGKCRCGQLTAPDTEPAKSEANTRAGDVQFVVAEAPHALTRRVKPATPRPTARGDKPPPGAARNLPLLI